MHKERLWFVPVQTAKEPSGFNLNGLRNWILAGSLNTALSVGVEMRTVETHGDWRGSKDILQRISSSVVPSCVVWRVSVGAGTWLQSWWGGRGLLHCLKGISSGWWTGSWDRRFLLRSAICWHQARCSVNLSGLKPQSLLFCLAFYKLTSQVNRVLQRLSTCTVLQCPSVSHTHSPGAWPEWASPASPGMETIREQRFFKGCHDYNVFCSSARWLSSRPLAPPLPCHWKDEACG